MAEQQARPDQGSDIGILVTIRSLLPNLAPVERRVAQAVLDDPEPYVPGSFDDVVLAYDLGWLSAEDFDILAVAAG